MRAESGPRSRWAAGLTPRSSRDTRVLSSRMSGAAMRQAGACAGRWGGAAGGRTEELQQIELPVRVEPTFDIGAGERDLAYVDGALLEIDVRIAEGEAIELDVVRGRLPRPHSQPADLRLRHIDDHPDTAADALGGRTFGPAVDRKAALKREGAARDVGRQHGTEIRRHGPRVQTIELERPMQCDRLREDRTRPVQPAALTDGGRKAVTAGGAAGGAEVEKLEAYRIEIEVERRGSRVILIGRTAVGDRQPIEEQLERFGAGRLGLGLRRVGERLLEIREIESAVAPHDRADVRTVQHDLGQGRRETRHAGDAHRDRKAP